MTVDGVEHAGLVGAAQALVDQCPQPGAAGEPAGIDAPRELQGGRLKLRDERIVELGGLGLPPDDSASRVAGSDAVQLFVERAQRVSSILKRDIEASGAPRWLLASTR